MIYEAFIWLACMVMQLLASFALTVTVTSVENGNRDNALFTLIASIVLTTISVTIARAVQ